MNARTKQGFVLLTAIIAGAFQAGAQDPRTGIKLDAPSSAAFRAILDSAKAQGIPVQPLWDRLYQGEAVGADGPRIIAAVRSLAFDIASVQRQLGTLASSDEIKAAASAVRAGVPAVELGKIKQQSGLKRSLALPFTVLTDIVSRGVPVGSAVNAVKSMLGAGAKDNEINDFQRNVKDDIQQGAPPAAAAETRAKSTSDKDKAAEKKPEEKLEK